MAIWIQSLAWALIYSLGQGTIVYASLWMVLKLLPAISPRVKYHLSLAALTVLLVWFAGTWWQQFHTLKEMYARETYLYNIDSITLQDQLNAIASIKGFGNYREIISSFYVLLPWLSAFYFVGLVFMIIRLMAGMTQLGFLRSKGLSRPEQAMDELLASLKSKMQYDGYVQLYISAKAQVPMVIGFLKPMILMPAAAMAQLTTEQLETILLHELAHIKRHDYLVNILQTVVETILFFNPFAWMISANIRREREHCCDDLVLDHTCEPLYYASALAALAEGPEQDSTFIVAASGDTNYLFHRIKRIMEMKKNKSSYSRMVAAILIVTAITASALWLTPAFAGDKNKPNEPEAKKPAVTTNVTPPADNREETILANALMKDRLVDQIKGFVVEKKQDKLYINGMQQTDDVARKYLAGMKQEMMRIQVFSLLERMKMHPDAGFLQVLLPVQMSSGCVQYAPKEGC